MTATLTLPPTSPPPPAAGAPVRRRGPGTKAVSALAVLFAVATVAYGCFTFIDVMATRTTRSVQGFAATPTITLDIRDGGIHVSPATDGRITVTTRVRHTLRSPSWSVAPVGSTLRFRSRCPAALTTSCDVEFDVALPPGTAIVGSVGDGGLHVTGIGGPVDVTLGDGTSRVSGARGAIRIHSSDGSIHLTDARPASLDLRTGDGSIHATLTTVPPQTDLRTGDGSIELVLPDDGRAVAVDATTGDGSVHDEVRTDQTADRVVHAHTGDGSVTVRYP